MRYTLNQQRARRDNKSQRRTGSPSILTRNDWRKILRWIKADPFIHYCAIIDRLKKDVSKTTILREIKASGYGHWKAKKRPKLLEEHAKIRLEWALAHRNWTLAQWRIIIWTDECSVEVGKGKRDQWVFRLNPSGEKWKKKYIQPYSKSKNISIMIWAAIWGGGHSEAIEMTRDPNAPKKGYSARSYLSLLEEMIPTIWSPGMDYMHDNASIHTAKIVKA